MSIYLGDTKISGNSKELCFPLFTPVWQDHIVNNASWLRSETFSWQSGAVYVSAYNHLADDIDGITSETETVAGTTITFYRATDGHKIVLPDQESNVEAIYTATGVAWYYILDTTNQRFKLPRSKWNFVGLRGDVSGYVAESLPNITAYIKGMGGWIPATQTGAFYATEVGQRGTGSDYNETALNFDASRSSSTYQNGAPVQQRATQAYLYFYVGNTIQDQTTIDVGEITEDLNSKADIDLGNLSNAGKIVGSGLGMPSNSYDDLTLGASGDTYTAPADGYFFLHKACGITSAYLASSNTGNGYYDISWGPNFVADDLSLIIPVKKDDEIKIYYNATGTTKNFRFIYAEGSKSLA